MRQARGDRRREPLDPPHRLARRRDLAERDLRLEPQPFAARSRRSPSSASAASTRPSAASARAKS